MRRSDFAPQILTTVETIEAETEILMEHIHTPSLLAPSLDDGVAVESDDGTDWALGVFSDDLLAINEVTEPFDLHFLNVQSADTNGTYEFHFFYGPTDIFCGACQMTRTDKKDTQSGIPIVTGAAPHGRIPANSRVRAKVACSDSGGDAVISVGYHPY